MARGDSFDLILLDIMLPGLDGLSLCRMIRNDSASANVPIIMLTARGTEVDKIVGLESGADDYMVKPIRHRRTAGAGAGTDAPPAAGSGLESS